MVKGFFGLGTWQLDIAARYCFGNYVTIEHLSADALAPKTSRRHFGLMPGLGLWWYRRVFLPRYLRSIGPRRIVCVSDAARKRLVGDFCFPSKKVVTVRNGIDAAIFHPDITHRDAWRSRLGIPGSALVLGAVGRLHPVKGYDIALAGFKECVSAFVEKDIRLLFIGDGEHEQALRRRAETILPHGRIIFAPFSDRPWEALNALDIFLMPSLNEGLPFALLEAMACGCCPVATAVGGVPEVIQSPELGWLVPAGDEGAFAAAMKDAASQSSEKRSAMGRNVREHVRKNFNSTTQFKLLSELIESLAATRSQRPFTRKRVAAEMCGESG